MIKVARLEISKYLRHPLVLALLALSLTLIAMLYYRICVDYLMLANKAVEQREFHPTLSGNVFRPVCSWIIAILALVIPVFTTLSISQELRQKSFILLATSPLSATQIVIGKFFSLLFFLFVLLLFTLVIMATFSIETTLDWGMLITALTAIGLMGCSFICFGLFISSLISQPLLAIGVTYLGNAFWMLLEWLNPFPEQNFLLAKELSLISHSYYLLNGILYSPDLVYYFMFSFFWIMISIHIVKYKMTHINC